MCQKRPFFDKNCDIPALNKRITHGEFRNRKRLVDVHVRNTEKFNVP